MKNLFFIIVISVLIFSCKKDDETPQIDQSLFPGAWELTDLDYTGTSKTSYLGQVLTVNFVGSLIESDLIVTFTENPNEFQSEGSYTIELTSEILGVKSTSYETIDEVFLPGSWEIVGNKLLVTSSVTEPAEVTIESLSESELTISQDETEDFSQDGVNVTSELSLQYTFTRVP